MKRGYITKTNKKGQIVIPKKIRTSLDINSETLVNIIKRGEGVYIYPISDLIPRTNTEKSYLETLKKTKGSWSNEDWDKIKKKKRKVELKASKKRKKEW